MKCKNCGGQYKTKELMCPYCHTENLLGKIWMVQRSEAEEAYEREKRELGKTMLSPYMINRYLNRALVVSILLFTSIFVGMILIALGYSGIRELRLFINKDENFSLACLIEMPEPSLSLRAAGGRGPNKDSPKM